MTAKRSVTGVSPQQNAGDAGEGEAEPDDAFEDTGVQLVFVVEEGVQGTRVYSQFYTTAVTTQGLELELGYLVDARGPLTTEACTVVSFVPELFTAYVRSASGSEGGDKTGSVLSLTLLDLIFDGLTVPSQATLDRGELTAFDEAKGEIRDTVVEDAQLTFDPQQGFEAIGTVTLPSGATVPLAEYLGTLLATYRSWWMGAP